MVKLDRVDHESEGLDEGGSVCGGVAPNTHMETGNWTSVVSWKILLSACQPNKVGAPLGGMVAIQSSDLPFPEPTF